MTQTKPQVQYREDYQPPHYWIDTLDLDIQLHDSATEVVAISRVRRNGEHDEPLVLDGEQLELLQVAVNGVDIAQYQQTENGLILSQLPEEFVLTIKTRIDPAANTALEGLYKSGSAFCTQCEAQGFRRITYYLDRPDVLARFSTRITADAAAYPYLLSNGNRVSQGQLDDGRHWVQWQDPFPKPAYLFALVAGDFDVLRDSYTTMSGRDVALEIFVDKGNLHRAGHAMDSLKASMAWDEQRCHLEYDLDIYMIVAVDFFNMGAMENKGLNVFNAKFVLADANTATDNDYLDVERVIGHEYFHNWTGNRVTCRDWFQLSLKEGLTVFRDQEFSSDLGSRTVNRIQNVRIMRGPQFAEDAGPMAHPIRPDAVIEMNNFYTLTVYEKGSEVIRMLHTLLGEQAFQSGLALYLQRHDGQAATCDDFVAAMSEASGRDLTRFKRWYSQAGTPVLTVTDDFDAEQQRYTLTVRQHTPATREQPGKLPLHIPLSLALYTEQGEPLSLRVNGEPVGPVLDVLEDEQQFVFEQIPSRPTPALLQGFSAPVKLDYPYTDEQLTLLAKSSIDEFVRWDAVQMLINKAVVDKLSRLQRGDAAVVSHTLTDVFRATLEDVALDRALQAQMLTLPDLSSLLELFEQVDIGLLGRVHQQLYVELAEALKPLWQQAYEQNLTPEYRIDHQDIARRAMKNVALGYLALAGDVAKVQHQYQDADNMTDTLAAMKAAVRAESDEAEAMLTDFEAKWRQDGLVLDNWFRLQATAPGEGTLAQVRQLMSHPTFSLNNPNRVRALIGAFISANPLQFHRLDGAGYDLLVSVLEQLNDSNPQVASRLVTPLIQFSRLDDARQALIKARLQQLMALPALSRDLFEKISKALA
ncbi:aminopeptidase N [Oceanisphaera arctica]|uniref:Aminopeptidase N n=1 Tax=Oceanisphaera arctica TaxID=641510 RepID=A0A2P5TJX5_9GAMM|nr:aminopeptidase N [Oceanisphaera arctica]PPL15346.1 aminopeptidase N [Oceanisphaera arctica]GHA29343.1 aminopeptidase N [Oceanisphaera arctica]